MRLSQAPVVDVRGPRWPVKDIALHLLDVDLSWLASGRDHGEAAWRLLTGARYDPRQVRLSGDPALAGPLLEVRGIIV